MSIVVGGTTYPYCAEILPPIGVTSCFVAQYFCCALIGSLTPTLTNVWPGIVKLSIFFTCVCTAGIFIVDYIVIETKGKTVEEIDT